MTSDYRAQIEQAQQLQKAGRLAEACAVYEHILDAEPRHPEALYLSGTLAVQAGRADMAESLLRQALESRPEYHLARYDLGELLHRLKRYQEAESEYRRVLAALPDNVPALINLGNVLWMMRRYEEAAQQCRRALALAPDFAEGWHMLGNVLDPMGDLEGARHAFAEALRLNPAMAGSHRHLSRLKTYREGDEQLAVMQALLARPDLAAEARGELHFALGKACHDLKKYDEAFGHYREGNRLRRTGYKYDAAQTAREFDEVKEVFARLLPTADLQAGCSDETPIFILGMPRSGTTLAEQILSSHPDVHGAGEVSHLTATALYGERLAGKAFPGYAAALTAGERRTLGADYVARLRQNAPPGVRRITDKMPDNFRLIGLIALLLPKARIIHCRRDPLDTCLSIFRAHFLGAHPYAYDLRELGQYYRLYRELMAFWHDMLPGRICDLQYETLVDDTEAQVRQLLAHCGLAWDERCLQFHDNRRSIATASSAQVRQPIYRSSVKASGPYEAYLGPLKEALGA